MRLVAPAKINLHLRVGPVAANGFHPLVSWMVTVGLFDRLTIRASTEPGIALSCDDPSLPTDSRNLVYRAAQALRNSATPDRERTREHRGVAIDLKKSIPSAAGLGGGSSDAARTILGLNPFWNLGRSLDELAQIGATIGSDVPFFFHGPSSICSGRGEIVRPIARPRVRYALLILPPIALSTKQVYEVFDYEVCDYEVSDVDPSGKADPLSDRPDWEQPDWNHWASLDADALLPRLVNDLEPAAYKVSPVLARLRSDLEQRLSRVVRMSGSGSSLFTLFDEAGEADRALDRIRETRFRAMAVPIAPDMMDDLVR